MVKRQKRDPYSYDYLLKEKIAAEKRWLEVYTDSTKPSIILGFEKPNRLAIDAAITTLNAVDFKILKTPHRALITYKLEL